MIRRTFNIPVFVVTVVGLAGAASGFHFVRQWQLTRLSQTFRDRSRAAEAREDWLAAATELERSLQIEPQQAAVRRQLATVYGKGAKTLDEKQRAVALHYRALATRTDGDATELRLTLAELLLQTGRLMEAENESRQILLTQAKNARAHRVFALARYLEWRGGGLAAQQPDELRLLSSIEAALALNPADIALAEIAATLYRDAPALVKAHDAELTAAQAEERAAGFLDQAVRLNPSAAEARLQGKVLDDKAETRLNGKHAEALLARHLYGARYGLEGAGLNLEAALQAAPHHPQVLLVASEDSYQQAKKVLEKSPAKPSAEVLLDKCQKYLRRLIDDNLMPDNAQPHLRLGDVLVLQGELNQAMAHWQSSLARFSQPTSRVAFYARIADHLLRAGRVSQAKPSLDAIQAIVDELGGVIRREDHLSLLQAQGLRQATYDLALGHYERAIERLQRAIAQQPQLQPDLLTSHVAWELLGRCYSGLKRWEDAATAYDRAANFVPTAGVRLAAAKAWELSGRPDLALDRTEQAEALRQTAATQTAATQAAAETGDELALKVKALMKQGRVLEAIRLCQEAAQSDESSRPAVVLTSLLLETGPQADYMVRAEPLLTAALQKFPKEVELLYGIGMLRVLENKYPDAALLLRRVLRQSPRHIAALNNLSMLLAESDSTRTEALSLVEQALEIRGEESTLLDTKGTILLRMGRRQEAVALLEAAARGPDADPRYRFHLALAYRELGETDQAERELQAAAQDDLEQQILTPTDRQALAELRRDLAASTPSP